MRLVRYIRWRIAYWKWFASFPPFLEYFWNPFMTREACRIRDRRHWEEEPKRP